MAGCALEKCNVIQATTGAKDMDSRGHVVKGYGGYAGIGVVDCCDLVYSPIWVHSVLRSGGCGVFLSTPAWDGVQIFRPWC